VKLSIYDINGKVVEKLLDEEKNLGRYSTQWNAAHYSSGIYFYKIMTGNIIETGKCILVK